MKDGELFEFEGKKYRPFTWEERDQLRGKWVKDTGSDIEHPENAPELMITKFIILRTKPYVAMGMSFDTLCTECVFVDTGLPVGVEVGAEV